MNTIQIDKIMKKDKYSKNIYLGTFPIDMIPTKIKFPSCLIVNNQKSNQAGEHWVAIYFDENKNGVFFDSFGQSPKFYGIDNYLNYHVKSYSYNKKRVQSFWSKNCGYYCILFLLLKCRNKTLDNYLDYLDNPSTNDLMIKNFLKMFDN